MRIKKEYDMCRYGEIAASIWKTPEYQLVYDKSVADWQGQVLAIFRNKKTDTFTLLEYTYGSCSGCDDWESRRLSTEQIAAEMKNLCASEMSRAAMIEYARRTDMEIPCLLDK